MPTVTSASRSVSTRMNRVAGAVGNPGPSNPVQASAPIGNAQGIATLLASIVSTPVNRSQLITIPFLANLRIT